MCEQSGGVIERCEAKDIDATLDDVLALNVVASNVVITVKLHKYLRFRNEQPQDLADNETCMKREIGNASKEAAFTFEYELKSCEELLELAPADEDLANLQEVPFQV